MAENWTLNDGAKAILANNEAAILELGKRFPLTTTAIASMGNNEGAMKIFGALPINVTMRKVEANLKDGVVSDEDGDEDAEETPKKAKVNAEDKKAAAAERRKARRAARKADKKADAEAEEEMEAEEEAEGTDYTGMNAVELFKECKKRGIKAAPKQKAAEYIKLLKAADEEANAKLEEAEDEDDGWGDDEEEEAPAPKKAPKKEKASKKAPKKVEEDEEDEDDDWDI